MRLRSQVVNLSWCDLLHDMKKARCVCHIAMMKTNFFLSFPIHVRRLVATRNRLAAPAGRALSSMLLHNQTVTLLDLTDNNLDSDAGIAIAEGLKKNETLRYLILARNNMGTEAGQAMASVIKRNRTLVRIDLSFNRVRAHFGF